MKPVKSDPLSFAVAERDAQTLDLVQAAIKRQNVLLAFQPVVQAKNPKKPAFYEGLVRVLDTTGRIIPAKDFIDTIETTTIGRQIDCLSLKLGLETLAATPGLRLSINMSARSIGFKRWLETLELGLRLSPTVAERLILEITEASAMIMPDTVQAFMADLQTRGVTFALDDFGAGYTSFRYLRDFYFDILKIDGQFIKDINKNTDNQILAQALISIGQHFDMFTVAEFVETGEEAAFLADIGIDCLQGYYIGKPTTRPYWTTAETRRQTA